MLRVVFFISRLLAGVYNAPKNKDKSLGPVIFFQSKNGIFGTRWLTSALPSQGFRSISLIDLHQKPENRVPAKENNAPVERFFQKKE